MDHEIDIQDLGRLAYEPAFERQRQTHAAVAAGQQPDTILLVEHEPVVTISKRQGAERNIVANEAMLAAAGVEVCRTDRGGDVTYHGPGQIVAYPIIRLNDRHLNLRQYVWLLEQAMIDTVGKFGIEAGRDQCAVGVWVREAKLAAIGVRASKWVTMHGLALNVTTNLDHFNLIVPCGLVGRPVTSMQQLLGNACPAMENVKAALVDRLIHHLDHPTAARSLPAR